MAATVRHRDYTKFEAGSGKPLTVVGSVVRLHTMKTMIFVEIVYGTSVPLQVVIPKKVIGVPTGTTQITVGSYLEITGTVSTLPEGKRTILPYELVAESVTVVGTCETDFTQRCAPDSTMEVQLKERHLYLRDPIFKKITKVRAQFMQACRKYFDASHTEIIPPIFTGTECEGGASLFKVQHPGVSTSRPMTAYLAQSSQFALEYAQPGLGDVYCIAPSFRAEHSQTRRHLTEFTHVEAEWGDITSLEEHHQHLLDMLKGIISCFLEIAKETLVSLGVYERVQQLYAMTDDIVTLSHKDAITMCNELGIHKEIHKEITVASKASDSVGTSVVHTVPFDIRDDIPEKQERKLIDHIGKIVFLSRFPKEFKSFYMKCDPTDPSYVLGTDVEVPGVGEIIGSGVRESDHDTLLAAMLAQGLKPEDYTEYLDLRKYGFQRTSGMGLGFDRMLCWLLGDLKGEGVQTMSIREVSTFPRFPAYLRP
jgi:asparaginyl-tRNA synthetase